MHIENEIMDIVSQIRAMRIDLSDPNSPSPFHLEVYSANPKSDCN